jgi:amino acid adenylation domain-containing protein
VGVSIGVSDKNIQAILKYRTSRMSSGQARHVAYAFRKAVDSILHMPKESTKNVSLFDIGHSRQVMRWNRTVPETKAICAHQEIMRQAADYPDAPAVCSWDGNLTYRELDEASNHLANHLVNLGVGPEVIVPLCFEKSMWAIVAMISVVKAGGAIVFLDPSHPIERRQLIIDTVGAQMVLSSQRFAHLFEETIETHIINGETLDEMDFRAEAPNTEVKPSNVLYVIFTSGSTGTPKGCLVEHQNFCSGVMYQKPFDNFIQRTDRVLQLASYSFDVSIMEIISALMIGACICVPSQESMQGSLTQVINELQASWAFLTPSLARILDPAAIPLMRCIVLGGEPLSRTDIETWAPRLQLVNGYGPSECSVAATSNPRLTPTTDPANIGKPMGSLAWIVDANDHNKLVPIGATGELLLEGPILARGYLNNPEKTAAAFIENPAFLNHDGPTPRRLYKTGDLARNAPDGSIHFIGRKDTQVKLRGQRIELGEIEHHLSVDERINHAMVIASKEGACKDRLVAVLTLKNVAPLENPDAPSISLITKQQLQAAKVRIRDISDALSDHVPAYMVPTAWVVLNQIPLMVSGKLNRVAVKSWVQGMTEETFEAVNSLLTNEEEMQSIPKMASSDVEKIVQEAFSKVLKVPIDQVSCDISSFGKHINFSFRYR